jgi:diamine N-acetyltransferase
MMRTRLRPTLAGDLDFVLALQHDAALLAAVAPWERGQHEAATRFADLRHFIIEDGNGLEPAGFVVLGGCLSPHRSVELKHMMVATRGTGVGRAAMRLLKRQVFEELGAHRLWLEVPGRNARAAAFYNKEGFVLEGRLRDALRVRTEAAGGMEYDSLAVLSMLQQEFATRRTQGLEMLE